jgi:hypothetical protein
MFWRGDKDEGLCRHNPAIYDMERLYADRMVVKT